MSIMSNFADIMNQKKNQSIASFKIGALLKGKVIGTLKIQGIEYYSVDCGLKYEGLVKKQELSHLDISQLINFYVLSEKNNYVYLSYNQAIKEEFNKEIKKYYKEGTPVMSKIISKEDKGYKVLIKDKISGFLNTDKELELGTEEKLFISKIFSNGSLGLSFSKSNSNLTFEKGDVINGRVISFNDYFVFIDIENSDAEGIIHFQDLSWNKINFPSEIVSQEENLKLKVLDIQNNCVYLGLKQTQEDPWNQVRKDIKINENYESTIQSINDYELIVKFQNDIMGAVHISQISWGFKKGSTLDKDFKVGEKIQTKLLSIDSKNKKILLSIKALLPNPFSSFMAKYKIGDIVEGTILHDAVTYGTFLFVEIINGVDGILHQSEMDWDMEKSIAKFNNLEKKQKIKVKIIKINEEKKNVSVSVKQMVPDVFDEIQSKVEVGKSYNVEIMATSRDGLTVSMTDYPKILGFVKRNDISNDRQVRIQSFIIGSKIKVKLIKIIDYKRLLCFSIKAHQNDVNKNAIKQNQNSEATSSFGDFFSEA